MNLSLLHDYFLILLSPVKNVRNIAVKAKYPIPQRNNQSAIRFGTMPALFGCLTIDGAYLTTGQIIPNFVQ